MKKIKISVSTESDEICPKCESENIKIMDYDIDDRTELHMDGYCNDCNCDFIFIYTLYLTGIRQE